MKYMRQFGIILGVTCAGELMKYFIPLPIPGSIYGLLLMFVLLLTKVIKVENVKDVGDHAIDVYSCRCGADGILGRASGVSGTSSCNHSIHHFYCYFCDWKSNGFYDESKGKNKQKEPESKGGVKKDGKYSS